MSRRSPQHVQAARVLRKRPQLQDHLQACSDQSASRCAECCRSPEFVAVFPTLLLRLLMLRGRWWLLPNRGTSLQEAGCCHRCRKTFFVISCIQKVYSVYSCTPKRCCNRRLATLRVPKRWLGSWLPPQEARESRMSYAGLTYIYNFFWFVLFPAFFVCLRYLTCSVWSQTR